MKIKLFFKSPPIPLFPANPAEDGTASLEPGHGEKEGENKMVSPLFIKEGI